MTARARDHYDVTVIGAGPAGTVAAIAQAQKGARVLLVEANPNGVRRLAGEWLHPPALEVVRELGIDLAHLTGRYETGEGFVLFPDDASDPVRLPYADGARGFSCEHAELVSALREAARAHDGIDYLPFARVTDIRDGRCTIARADGPLAVSADLVVGADGRNSVLRRTLGLAARALPVSRMIGLRLNGVEMPFEGFGHVFLGGSGPLLVYRIGPDTLRLIADIPLNGYGAGDRTAHLWEEFGPVLPAPLRAAFREALSENAYDIAVNAVSPRASYGRGRYALVGDAAGHYHPLTALGMTLGFADGMALAGARNVDAYRRRRLRECRVPEMVAIGIHQSFSRLGDDAVAVRRAIVDLWRTDPDERRRTMRYLACQDRRVVPFVMSFLKVMGRAMARVVGGGAGAARWRHASRVIASMAAQIRSWIGTTLLHRNAARPGPDGSSTAVAWRETPAGSAPRPAAALNRGVAALIAEQGPDGGWEGEVVWCPMLAAQYVLMCHITGIAIPEERRRRLLLHFRDTRFADGLWGMHAHSEPYLFVTTLVYVAARLLGLGHSDPLLKPAQDWIRREGGVAAIPSWGKFWLAMLGLYDWRGVNPILPEAWTLPRWMPLHPSNFYCHTRLIYMGMAAIYGRGLRAEIGPTVAALRDELYPGGYDKTDFRAARHSVRTGDLYRAPGRALRMLYATSRLIDRFRIHGLRERAVAAITAAIRWELRTTDHTSISPVSGLLNIIALWLADPSDVDFRRAVERFEGWFWEDDRKGARVAGARSASWDTAFALQALAAAAPHADLGEASTRGAAFLAGQQIRRSFAGFADAYRIDPKGGWCFAGVWHGWPVSDCAAEAVSALVAVRGAAVDAGSMEEAVRFILRCQNRDGGFGSYEPRKTRVGLEFLNPAEMFGESMTETSFVECTSSAVAALREARLFCPDPLRDQVDHATGRAARWLRRKQAPDGTWPAAWGVNFIYGVMFGVTGLLAAGAPTYDPAIRKACRWLEARQRRDGGWGEHHASCLTGRYVEHDESQIVQTAWALRTLLAAEHPNWPAIDHGARFLTASQNGDGTWPAQDMAGVFFRTALLDYTLYRSYFPVWALGLYETRRKSRLSLAAATRQAA